jgi:predicted metal-dependent phosphoesterase TrpH
MPILLSVSLNLSDPETDSSTLHNGDGVIRSMRMTFTGRADLHMHSCLSDGLPTPQQILDYVAQRGHLDVIAITDHDVIEGSLWAFSQQKQYPFEIVPGMEVTACDGHVLALWVTEIIPAQMSVAETVAAIHEQQGIAILAHPCEIMIHPGQVLRYLQDPSVLLPLQLDGIEVFNAGTITPGNNLLADRVCAQLPLPQLGNSDAHTLNAIGLGHTRFPGRSAADLREAIIQGATAVEGKRWPVTDYLKLSLRSIPRKRSATSVPNLPSIRPA